MIKKAPIFMALIITLGSLSALQFSCPVEASSVEEIEQKRDEAQNELNNLNDQAQELSEKVSEYNIRYKQLAKQMDEVNEKIKENNTDIQELNAALEKIRLQKEERYNAMKQRIAFNYENRNKSVLLMLFESGSIYDFLNRIEFILAMNDYDQNIMDLYVQSEEELNAKTEELSSLQSELNNNLMESQEAQSQMKKIADEAGDALNDKNREIDATRKSIEEFDKEIAALRQKERAIAEANAAALAAQIEAMRQQIENQRIEQEDNSGAVSVGEADLLLLAATIQAEADGEGYEGRLGVASVIMNRVNSSLFPNTISGVVYQNKQFSCVNYTLPLILARGANEGCKAVAAEAIAGARNTTALFFMTPAAAQRLGQTGTPLGNGGHVFFDIWQR